jgi:hypothetical protein
LFPDGISDKLGYKSAQAEVSREKGGKMSWNRTNWMFTTSGGGELTIGEVLNVGITGGVLYAKHGRNHRVERFGFGAVGIGLSESPIPVALDFSTPGMASGNCGQIYVRDRQSLTPSDFWGFTKIINAQGGVIVGASAVIVFFGIRVPPYPGAENMARGFGAFWGANCGIQFGAGAMYYTGLLGSIG